MNRVSGHSRPVSYFKCIYFCFAVYGENVFVLGRFDFFFFLLQYLECPLWKKKKNQCAIVLPNRYSVFIIHKIS